MKEEKEELEREVGRMREGQGEEGRLQVTHFGAERVLPRDPDGTDCGVSIFMPSISSSAELTNVSKGV